MGACSGGDGVTLGGAIRVPTVALRANPVGRSAIDDDRGVADCPYRRYAVLHQNSFGPRHSIHDPEQRQRTGGGDTDEELTIVTGTD